MSFGAVHLPKRLAVEMAGGIEDVFSSCGLRLFQGELKASRTCPHWESPWEHVAAAYYILAERFDDDPFLIFAWRGRDKHEPLECLRARGGAGPVAKQPGSRIVRLPSGLPKRRYPEWRIPHAARFGSQRVLTDY